jgi:hypothetical protein
MTWATPHIPRLRAGETITCRPPGGSMHPLIRRGQRCTIAPLGDAEIRTRDIVLCTVGRNDYLHLVTAMRRSQYQISNNKGHVNGWISRSAIHGRLVATE